MDIQEHHSLCAFIESANKYSSSIPARASKHRISTIDSGTHARCNIYRVLFGRRRSSHTISTLLSSFVCTNGLLNSSTVDRPVRARKTTFLFYISKNKYREIKKTLFGIIKFKEMRKK